MMDLSAEAETIWRLSAEKETERTSAVWPTKRLVLSPVRMFQSRSDLSHEADMQNAPSEEVIRSEMKCSWPVKILCGEPAEAYTGIEFRRAKRKKKVKKDRRRHARAARR